MNIDFEKLIEDQKEEEMPENVIWIAIEQKHLTKIARCWTIFCMMVQILTLFITIGVFCFIPMIHFSSTKTLPKLTAIFFIDNGYIYHFYFGKLHHRDICEENIVC